MESNDPIYGRSLQTTRSGKVMSRSGLLPLPHSLAKPQATHSRHWLQLAEYVSIGGSALGTVAAIAFQQVAYASVPLTLALSCNFANRYRGVQAAKQEAAMVASQTKQLQQEMQSLHTSLQGLQVQSRPQDDRQVVEVEASLTRLSERLVELEGRHEALSSHTQSDRDKIKEAFAILRQGLYRLQDRANGALDEVRGEVESLRGSLSGLPATGVTPNLGEIEAAIARVQADLQTLARQPSGDFTELHEDLYQLSHRISQLEQNNRDLVSPHLQRLTRAVQNLQSSAPPEELAEVPDVNAVMGWLGQIDQRLEAITTYDYQLVMDSDRSRELLLQAIDRAQKHVIIVSPWLQKEAFVQDELLDRIEAALQRNLFISIGWGDRADIAQAGETGKPITLKTRGWRYHAKWDTHGNYSALSSLMALKKRYKRLSLRLLGTHEKFVACDRAWVLLGSYHPFATPLTRLDREMGLYTNDPRVVSGSIDRFKLAPRQRT